ncbi:MAG: type II and III secretion system protein family protein [Henriciella sp.]|nr:type II and III secretion system protein family protein [Henriciella sp.]
MKRNRYLLRASLSALALAGVPTVAGAQNLMGVEVVQSGDNNVSKTVKLSLDKSTIIELARPAADVVITNPTIADAVVQTAQRIIFRGNEVGQTNAFIFDAYGNPLLNLEIIVDIDVAELEDLISRYVPDARVNIEMISGSFLVKGTVENLAQADQVLQLVKAYSTEADDTPIVNMMSIAAKDQVMLEVRIVEMQRTVVKQLGVNLSGTTNFGELANLTEQTVFDPTNTGETVLAPGEPFTNTFGVSSSNGYNVAGTSLGGLSTNIGYTNYVGDTFQSSVGATIDALERVGIIRTLAEPNIMAVSGESAKFLAGGEYPVPVGSDENGNISVEFKPYGVGLGFTPFVLSEDRISLKVSTEVSELTSVGALQGETETTTNQNGETTTVQGLTIPALTVRRAESTIELPSGGSTMLAGLIQSRSRQTLDQLPGIKKLPIIGALFQSRDFLNEETEMVVIVTPYLVDPTSKAALRTPADGFVNATDPSTIFFGKLNATYAQAGEELSQDTYNAPVGFIDE